MEFEKLGTYSVQYTVTTTHDNNTDMDTADDVDYSATGSYIFHVGPIADLVVSDGGPSSHSAASQNDLTIYAVNNGPANSPGAQVTGLPMNADVRHISQGRYDSSTGEWDIGELKHKDYRRSAGMPEHATLVLGASAGDTANVSIANSKNYEVCIGPKSNPVNLAHTTQSDCEAVTDASWNSTPVYDHKNDNNTAIITAQAGTGGGEGAPTLRAPAVHTPAVGIAWSEVDFLHGVPVKDYQVQWSNNGVSGWTQLESELPLPELFDITIQSGQTRYYRVRAVNEAGELGPWSAPMSATAGVVGISVSEKALTINEGETGEYAVSLLARPTSSVTVRVNAAGDLSSSPSRLTFNSSNWNTPQTVTLTARQDNDAVDDAVEVTHSVSSSDGAYNNLPAEPVAVTVIDDDSGVSIAADQQSVNEGDDIVLTLTRTGNTGTAITVTVSVTQSGDYLASDQAGQRTVDMVTGVTTAQITVATDNDTTLESAGTVFATVVGGATYFASSPSSARVRVQDDDGPPGQPVGLTAQERDGEVSLTWSAAPTGDAPVLDYSYRVRRSDSSAWVPDWTVLSGGSGRNSHTESGLTNGQEYTIQVRARNATGDGAAAEVTANPKDEPGAPEVTVASRDESLLVTWSVPDDGGRAITEYEVQWKSGNQSFDASRQATATTGENTISSLTNGTEYRVRVRARNEAGWGGWSSEQPGTPTPRPATSLSITTNAEDGVGEPFRVTFTFTDEDHDGSQYGVTGFDVDDIEASYASPTFHEFTLEDFREETTGLVYSALVNQLLDGRLRIRVAEGVAKSTHDDQESTSASLAIEVEPPQAVEPAGTEIWSAEMTVGDYSRNAMGYINPNLSLWDPDVTIGSLSDGNDATDDDDAFSYAGKNYRVGEISIVRDWNMILFVSCPGLEGADASFDLFLDDQVDGNRDHSLSFDPEKMDSSQLSGTIDGATQSCVEYRWTPQSADWKEGGKVNVRLVR